MKRFVIAILAVSVFTAMATYGWRSRPARWSISPETSRGDSHRKLMPTGPLAWSCGTGRAQKEFQLTEHPLEPEPGETAGDQAEQLWRWSVNDDYIWQDWRTAPRGSVEGEPRSDGWGGWRQPGRVLEANADHVVEFDGRTIEMTGFAIAWPGEARARFFSANASGRPLPDDDLAKLGVPQQLLEEIRREFPGFRVEIDPEKHELRMIEHRPWPARVRDWWNEHAPGWLQP